MLWLYKEDKCVLLSWKSFSLEIYAIWKNKVDRTKRKLYRSGWLYFLMKSCFFSSIIFHFEFSILYNFLKVSVVTPRNENVNLVNILIKGDSYDIHERFPIFRNWERKKIIKCVAPPITGSRVTDKWRYC